MTLDKDDVVSVEKNISFVGASTFTVKEASDKLAQFIQDRTNITAQVWTGEGARCRVLQVGSGRWKEGTIRPSLEFIPDEEEVEQEAELIEEIEPEENVVLKQIESLLDKIQQGN